jgi:hypothetical protein
MSGPSIWSKERTEYLTSAWQVGISRAEILAALNELPGPGTFTKPSQISDKAEHLHLRRPAYAKSERDKSEDRRRIWSPERLEVLKVDWPAGVINSEIMAKLNALPGPKITSRKQIAHYASGLGIKRPEGFLAQSSVWTDERDALVRATYPAGVPRDVILERLNALPGPRIDRPMHVVERSRVLGVKRPPGFQSPKPRNSAKKIAPPPRPQAIPKPPRSPSRSPLKAELRVIYNHGFQLWQDGYLPVTKRNDVDAINKAIRRAIPGHPGFQLLSKWGFA